MPLMPFSQVMAAAESGGYAVGYFEPWDVASMLAILRGAEVAHSPIVLGLSGIYLPTALKMEIRHFAAFASAGRIVSEEARVPVAYLFNETPYWDWAQASLRLGFNVTMYSNPHDDPETHVQRTAQLVQQAAATGVEVQSELGSLRDDESENTDPEAAADFVARTGVHALGVTAGNRHVVTGKYNLDLELIERLSEATSLPLVLHGGSGAQNEQLQQAIARGVRQVNYGTVQELIFLEHLSDAMAQDWRALNPHELLYTGLADDVMRPALAAVSALVAEKCRLLGSAGQA